MNPREAAFKGSSEIFFAVVSTSVTLAAVFLPIIFLEGFVGRLFREFGIVIAGAVLISMFVALSLTPMLNALMLKRNQKHSKFYEKTEPFFQGMQDTYAGYLNGFMRRRWVALVIIGVAGGLIWLINGTLQSELAPLEDRSALRISIQAPEGTSYEYTDAFVMKVVEFVMDSIPEKRMV